ncbi:37S ribosomal protein S9, mitochondrial [Coemansia sp. RSA 1200]|nr:37S ribosomal protein S9, mitochondrial [Coemansia sp. RSA 1200]
MLARPVLGASPHARRLLLLPCMAVSRRQVGQDSKLASSSKDPLPPSSPFDSLDIRPVQRPDTPSYFMPKPKYYDMLAAITNIVEAYPQPKRLPSPKALKKTGTTPWLDKKKVEERFGFKLSEGEFLNFRNQLDTAKRAIIKNGSEKHTVNLYLSQFVDEEKETQMAGRGKDTKSKAKNRGRVDAVGRFTAGGRRKTAFASVIIAPVNPPKPGSEADVADALMAASLEVSRLVGQIAEITARLAAAESAATDAAAPDNSSGASGISLEDKMLRLAEEQQQNQEQQRQSAAAALAEAVAASSVDVIRHAPLGEVLVNGRALNEYFVRETDRESVVQPMVVAGTIGKYNVFLRVKGGGHTGQAEACQLALSRALVACNRRKHLIPLSTAGLLVPDARFVERKKTGKPKARKSYTWVKR